jgi:hypothetical protein
MHADTKFAMLSDQAFGHPAEKSSGPVAEFGRYSLRIWIVLSIVMSLTITSIFAKHEMVGPSIIPVLVIPVGLTLYFKARIARLGEWVYAGTLVVVLSAAVLFGL